MYRGGSDPATAVSYQVGHLVNLVSGELRPLSPEAFPDGVQAVAGIGRPEQFYATLRRAGLAVDECTFPDHHAFEAADFARLDDLPVIMTEKDAVKCAALAGDNAWYLRISAILPEAVVKRVIGLARS